MQVKIRRLDGAEIDQSTKPASDWSGLDEEDEHKAREGREQWEGNEKREVDEITLDWSRLDQREEKR